MITQTALYKALSLYCKENKIDSNDVESVTGLINESVNSFSESEIRFPNP